MFGEINTDQQGVIVNKNKQKYFPITFPSVIKIQLYHELQGLYNCASAKYKVNDETDSKK